MVKLTVVDAVYVFRFVKLVEVDAVDAFKLKILLLADAVYEFKLVKLVDVEAVNEFTDAVPALNAFMLTCCDAELTFRFVKLVAVDEVNNSKLVNLLFAEDVNVFSAVVSPPPVEFIVTVSPVASVVILTFVPAIKVKVEPAPFAFTVDWPDTATEPNELPPATNDDVENAIDFPAPSPTQTYPCCKDAVNDDDI